MSFDPSDLAIGVLELFAEQVRLASRKALVATSESTPDRAGGRPKLKLFGFGVYRSWETQAAFQWRREAREQRQMDRRAGRRMALRKYAAKVHAERVLANREYRARVNSSPERKATRLAKRRVRQRRAYALAKRRAEQAARLAALKAKAAMTREERRAANERERYAERFPRPAKLQCCQCKRQFKPKRSDSMYCSAACKQKAYRAAKGKP